MPHTYEQTTANEADSIASHRLSATLQMISGLEHQSRNALQRAEACLGLLELGASESDEYHQLIAGVRRALTDLNRTYEQVRVYASPISLTRTSVDLKQLCEAVFFELAESRVHFDASLKFIDCGGVGKAILDPIQMRIVLRHLLDNAIAASCSNALIEVRCYCASANDRAATQLSIRDYGSGFDSSIASQLFEPFVTTKQRGAGLGLAVCRRIIEAHDGKINASNHPEGGVEVRITFPT